MDGMIAVIEARTAPDKKIFCAIEWTGRVRLHVEVKTYCDLQVEADDGVLQRPIVLMNCDECKARIKALIAAETPKKEG